jgi:hypothetical protein
MGSNQMSEKSWLEGFFGSKATGGRTEVIGQGKVIDPLNKGEIRDEGCSQPGGRVYS